MSSTPAARPPLDDQHPWPGLDSFAERDSAYFRGRDDEAEALFRYVQRGVLTVLYGVSGLGKTSLLEAGLFPRLRQARCLPVLLRLDYSESAGPLEGQLRAALTRAIQGQEVDAPPPASNEELWSYFHRTPFWSARSQLLTPVLVLDQFEEIFTLGRDHPGRRELRRLLGDLVENRIPDTLAGDGVELDFDYSRPRLKLLLALREDFLAQLEEWRPDLPSLMRNRFRLRPMHGETAQRAVLDAGAQVVESDATAGQIVRFVAGADSSGGEPPLQELTVEPALLSLFCRELNARRIADGNPHITADLLTDARSKILEDFYERTLVDLNPQVRTFVEDQLLTVSGYRDSVALDNALGMPGVTGKAVDRLVGQRLIRLVPGEHKRIELIHDVLCGVIEASRAERHERELVQRTRDEAEQARRRQEREHEQRLDSERAQLAEEREHSALRQAELERTALVRTRYWLALLAIMLTIIAATLYQAVQQREAAEAAKSVALIAEREARAQLELAGEKNSILEQDRRALEAERFSNVAVQEALWRTLHTGVRDTDNALALGLRPAGSGDDIARFWSGDSSRKVPLLALALAPDGSNLAVGSATGAMAQWRTTEPAGPWSYRKMSAADGAVVELRPSEGGGRWLVVTESGEVRICGVEIPEDPVVLPPKDGPVVAVWAAPSGWPVRTLAVSGILREWADSKTSQVLRDDMGPVLTAAFAGSGERMATGSFDGRVQLWEELTGPPRVLGRHAGAVLDVAFDPHGQLLAAVAADGTAQIWKTQGTDDPRRLTAAAAGLATRLAFAPDAGQIAVLYGDGRVRLWDLHQTDERPRILDGKEVAALDLAFHPDSRRLATAGSDGKIRLWSLQGDEARYTTLPPRGGVTAITLPIDINISVTVPGKWLVTPPQQAFCYQEDACTSGKDAGRRYSVHCHQTMDDCEKAHGNNPRTSQSACKQVAGLDASGWHPQSRGYLDSWYQFSAVPFAKPFPAVGGDGQVFMHIAREEQRDRAEELGRALCLAGFSVPGIERVKSSPAQTQLRHFGAHSVELKKLQTVLNKNGLKSIGSERTYDLSQRYTGMSAERFELWIGRDKKVR